MQGAPTTFWGKLQPAGDGGLATWHPLVDHCADVGAVAEALIRLPLWRRRLESLARRPLSEVCCDRLGVLATLHDLGKFNIGFQANGRPELGTTSGHVTEALGALSKPVFACLAELGSWGDAVADLLVSAICHHGRPYDANTASVTGWHASLWTARGGLDPEAGAAGLLADCRRWFPLAFTPSDLSLPEAPAFSHAFAGLVMLADWIGSDDQFFPFRDPMSGDRMRFAHGVARSAVKLMALDVDALDRRDVSGRDPFVRVVPEHFRPRAAQAAVLALPPDKDGSITILEAETGSGKTEAALARFVALFERGLVDGLYFALPTRSAATQMYRRVYAAAQLAFAVPPAVILAVPGYLRADDAHGVRAKLARFEVLWPDQGERFRYRAWAAESAKRYLVGCIVVGTIDQVLLSSLMVGHAHLRAAALLRHLLVVDEVHASDAYMARILEDVLARHRLAGGHALLLSATLGGEARARLVRPREGGSLPTLGEAEVMPYPLITHRAAEVTTVSVAHDSRSRTIEVEARPWLEDAGAVARVAVEAASRGAKVLVIKNTVRDCVETQLAVESIAKVAGRTNVLFSRSGVWVPHHARFASIDREGLDAELERRFGFERPDGGCIVVATQTVQQSLDLDADLLFSDLCPADVLLQRIGRLHRHRRPRPAGFGEPRAVVIVPGCRDLGALLSDKGTVRYHHGFGVVYDDLRLLEATWRLVESHAAWQIPEMNRHLVENSVHSAVLESIAASGGQRWQAHSSQMMGARLGQRRSADLYLVDWSKSYAESEFPSSADQRIPTRLGEGDRRVQFMPAFTGPFGNDISALVVKAWWARGVAPDSYLAESVQSADGVTRFSFGHTRFRYDRLGLRLDEALTKELAEDDGL